MLTNKLSGKIEYGRAYQFGRLEGNFLYVAECSSVQMPDAKSFPKLIAEHERLFGSNILNSVATDKGYYSHENHLLLERKQVQEIGLQRPQRSLRAPPNNTPFEIMQKLYNRRAGIEGLIGHLKHGWQMGRSRMRSDTTTLSAGYCAVLGFNLRQLIRYLSRKARPRSLQSTQKDPPLNEFYRLLT